MIPQANHKFMLNETTQEPTPITLIEEAKKSIFPSQFQDTLAAKIDITNQGTWKPSQFAPEVNRISSLYLQEINFGSLPVLRLDYRVYSGFNGYSLKITKKDFSEPKEKRFKEKISFYIKGDEEKGFTERLRIEFKNSKGEKGVYIIKGITGEWQKIEIDKQDVGGDFSYGFKSHWEDIVEIALVFE
ncbi:MAG: hypothetical protein NC821_03380, partial [Candidatus Omnitrophica bacterium]|nr:hypothetical protein [Candidatus Omnitrophota bacterium]